MSSAISETVSAEDRAKAQVLNHLLATKRIRRGDLIATEFVFGGSGCRADLVIFSDTIFGIEIKSEKDTLKRVKSQINSYYECCGKVIFAVAPKHLRGLSELGVSPNDTWSLLSDGTVRELGVCDVRNGRSNVDAIMTKKQLQKLDRLDIADERQRINHATKIISDRFVESSAVFWAHVGRRKVRASDISMMSRFRIDRQELAIADEQARRQWEFWNSEANKFFESVQ